MLSGGASRVQGLAEALGDRFEAPVEAFNPFRQVAFDTKKLGQDLKDELASTTAVAVGLALRRVDDR
jgi:Tfp pilus assembly PilM family ATPase